MSENDSTRVSVLHFAERERERKLRISYMNILGVACAFRRFYTDVIAICASSDVDAARSFRLIKAHLFVRNYFYIFFFLF